MGVGALVEGLHARTHGGTVAGGPANHFVSLPWWLIAPVGVFLLVLSLFNLWGATTKRD